MSSHPHHFGLPIQPPLHRLEHCFVFPTRDTPIVARRALRFRAVPGQAEDQYLCSVVPRSDGGAGASATFYISGHVLGKFARVYGEFM